MGEIIALPMGGGLDRHTGPMVAPGGSFRDLRNVLLGRGFARARMGAELAGDLGDDTVLALRPLATERVSIAVGYDEVTREVSVYRLTAAGLAPVLIGVWFTLDANASSPPRVSMAEAGGKVFLAHDEPIPTRRAHTVYYDPATASIENLTAAWVAGDALIRFAGVTPHFTHLAGWGFADGTEHGPHMIRHSLPGQPTTFELRHYMPVGQRGDPILACAEAAGVLQVFKATQRWEFLGSSRLDFDVVLVDELFGLIASRALWVRNGECFLWSLAGPRLCTRGPSVDLALPLGLELPEPADLVALGAETDNAFAAYLPNAQVVEFNFGQRVYALSLRPDRAWSYYERGFEPFCAGLLFPDSVLAGDPGYASALAVATDEASPVDPSTRDVTVSWTNNEMAGDEVLEFWIKEDGVWAQDSTALVGASGTQQHVIEQLVAGKAYSLQIRARRGGAYRADYLDPNPDLWPVQSLLAFTTAIGAPGLTAAWSRTSAVQEQITLTVTPVHADLDIEVYRDDGAGGAFVLLDTVTVAEHGGAAYVLNDVSDDEGLGNPNTDWGERTWRYRARSIGPSADSVDTEVAQWAGPAAPTDFVVTATASEAYSVEASWTTGDALAVTDLEDDFLCLATYVLNETAAAGDDTLDNVRVGDSAILDATTPVQLPTSFRVRHRLTTFAVEDFSPYATDGADVEGEQGEPDGYNTCP